MRHDLGLRMSEYESSRRLAAALRELDLDALAVRANRDEFNDYFSNHDFPLLKLVAELNKPEIKNRRGVPRLIERVKEGQFDGTPEEADAWMQSPKGQKAYHELTKGSYMKEKKEQLKSTTFEGLVSASDGKPFVLMTCSVGGEPVFAINMTPDVVTALGLRAIQAGIEAERDAGSIRFLREALDMNEQGIAVMLTGMREHRQQFDADAGSMRPLSDDDPSTLGKE